MLPENKVEHEGNKFAAGDVIEPNLWQALRITLTKDFRTGSSVDKALPSFHDDCIFGGDDACLFRFPKTKRVSLESHVIQNDNRVGWNTS